MMTLVEARNAPGTVLSLPLQESTNGLKIRDIQGLDPVSANLFTSQLAQIDGVDYQGANRSARNIVLTIGLDPDYVTSSKISPRVLRDTLYKWFAPKSLVSLRFYVDGETTVDIDGVVEGFAAPLFSNDPLVQVSIINPKPDFYNAVAKTYTDVSVASGVGPAITYAGSSETGFLFHSVLNAAVAATGIAIVTDQPDSASSGGIKHKTLSIVTAFNNGDIVDISTIQGNKYANLTRAGVVTSLLQFITPPTNEWIQLDQYMTNLRLVSATTGLPYTVTYNERFAGL